jgi:hypothetical protein
MKIPYKLSLALIASLTVGATFSYAGFYVRPEVSWNKAKVTFSAPGEPSESWSGDKLGFGAAGGFTFGGEGQHDLNVSVGQGKFTDASVVTDGVFVETTTLTSKITPLLFNYRYTFGKASQPVRFYIGPSIGWLRLEGEGVYRVSAGNLVLGTDSFSDTETGFAHGGRLGVAWKLTEQLALDFGYAHLRSTVEYDQDGFTYDMKVKGDSFSAGVAFTF